MKRSAFLHDELVENSLNAEQVKIYHVPQGSLNVNMILYVSGCTS